MEFKKTVTVVASIMMLVGGSAQARAERPPTISVHLVLGATANGNDAGYCSFPVDIDYISHQRQTDTILADGTIVSRFTGNARVTATNLNTGRQLKYNASGPGTVTTFTTGAYTIDAGGPNFFWTQSQFSFGSVPEIAYTHGRVRISVDAAGETTGYKLNGNSTDVCVALA